MYVYVYMCVFRYVYVCTCAHLCAYVYMYICLCVYICVYICIYILCIYVYACICMFICMYTCAYVYVGAQVCACFYVYMCTCYAPETCQVQSVCLQGHRSHFVSCQPVTVANLPNTSSKPAGMERTCSSLPSCRFTALQWGLLISTAIS